MKALLSKYLREMQEREGRQVPLWRLNYWQIVYNYFYNRLEKAIRTNYTK